MFWTSQLCSEVWTNFPKTIRTIKIVKRAVMLFICTTKTIVGSPVFWNTFSKPVTIVMAILMQNDKCNEMENAFPIFKVSRLVREHTDSHHIGHNKMIFAVSCVWYITGPLHWSVKLKFSFKNKFMITPVHCLSREAESCVSCVCVNRTRRMR